MTWRGYTTTLDRVFAALVYAFPLVEAYLLYSDPLFEQLPFLQPLFFPLLPFVFVYGLILSIVPFGLGGLVIFFALFLLVVRNERIRHFVRYNTMQAILIGIILSIFSILWALLTEILPMLNSPAGMADIFRTTIFNVLFLGTVAISVYSIVQSIRGKYAEIPTLSDAVYMQVR